MGVMSQIMGKQAEHHRAFVHFRRACGAFYFAFLFLLLLIPAHT
jgi:hypothetical protein